MRFIVPPSALTKPLGLLRPRKPVTLSVAPARTWKTGEVTAVPMTLPVVRLATPSVTRTAEAPASESVRRSPATPKPP